MSTPPVGMQPGQGPARQATLRDFFAIVFRRRWLILGLFFVVTATVLVIALTTPTFYSSSGRVLVTRGERESALTSHVQILNDWEQDLAGEVAKVRGTDVLNRARQLLVERAKLTRRAPLTLSARRVDVEVLGKSNVLGIGYYDLNPETAQEVCDALLTAYVEYRQERPVGETENTFTLQLDSLRRQIDVKSALRESIATSSGVVDPVEMTRSWNGELAQLEGRHDEVSADLAAAQSVVKSMRDLLTHPDQEVPALDTGSQFGDIALSQL